MDYKNVTLRYFAALRERSGQTTELYKTQAPDAESLFQELKRRFDFPYEVHEIKVAINNEYCPLTTTIAEGDHIVFIPPVAGG